MTTLPASAARRSVLADRLVSRRLATDVVLVASAIAFTSLMAQVVVPLYPVPITGQTLAVVLVGAFLGLRRGALSIFLYVLLGVLGAPILAAHTGGFAVLASPSFGYAIGFILSAAAIGWLAERNWDRKFVRASLAFTAASVIPYLTGLPWLAVVLAGLGAPHDLQSVLQAGLYPFIVGGIVKAVIAAGLLPAAWGMAGRRRPRG